MILNQFSDLKKHSLIRGGQLRYATAPTEWWDKHDYDAFLKHLAAHLGDEYLLRPDGEPLQPREPV